MKHSDVFNGDMIYDKEIENDENLHQSEIKTSLLDKGEKLDDELEEMTRGAR